jgi:AsmA protein
MKALRIIGIVFVVLLALLIAGVALLYAMFDGDKIKAEISRAVLEQKQRTLVIAGKPQLSIWPNVGIQLDGVSLSERASTTEFAALESARVSVAVLPLLSKQVQVSALDLVGLKATLIKRKDGTLNIADLLEPTDGKAPEAKPADTPQSAEPLQIDIKSIRIANAQLTWRDEQAGTTTAVSNLSLSSGRVQADTGKKTASVDALALSIKGSKDKDTFELTLNAPKLLLSPEKSSSDTITLTAQLQGPQRSASVNLALGGVEGMPMRSRLATWC